MGQRRMESPRPILLELFREYFNVYLHHLRQVNGRANFGCLRNCYHSVAQQLVRQDVAYYAIYVKLRKDRNFRLISSPDYVKYTQAGDSQFDSK